MRKDKSDKRDRRMNYGKNKRNFQKKGSQDKIQGKKNSDKN